MLEVKVKIKKIVIDLVNSTKDDEKLGAAVRKLINGVSLLKKEKKTEKSKKTKLPKVDKSKVDNNENNHKQSKISKQLKPMPEIGIPEKIKTESMVVCQKCKFTWLKHKKDYGVNGLKCLLCGNINN